MEHTKTSFAEPQTPEVTPRIIDYGELVKMLRSSIALEMNLIEPRETSSLEEVLATYDPIDQERINAEIGMRFDAALLRFLGSALIASRRRPLVINARVDEGIDGSLPWETALTGRIRSQNSHDVLSGADIRIERSQSAEITPIILGAVACDQLVTTVAA